MAGNSSNGDQSTAKQPPLPSPLRFSKFFQVNFCFFFLIGNFLATLLFSFVF